MSFLTLPPPFFGADTGYALVFLIVTMSIGAAFVSWLSTPSTHYAQLRQQQRLVELHAYAARLQARTRNGGVQ